MHPADLHHQYRHLTLDPATGKPYSGATIRCSRSSVVATRAGKWLLLLPRPPQHAGQQVGEPHPLEIRQCVCQVARLRHSVQPKVGVVHPRTIASPPPCFVCWGRYATSQRYCAVAQGRRRTLASVRWVGSASPDFVVWSHVYCRDIGRSMPQEGCTWLLPPMQLPARTVLLTVCSYLALRAHSAVRATHHPPHQGRAMPLHHRVRCH